MHHYDQVGLFKASRPASSEYFSDAANDLDTYRLQCISTITNRFYIMRVHNRPNISSRSPATSSSGRLCESCCTRNSSLFVVLS